MREPTRLPVPPTGRRALLTWGLATCAGAWRPAWASTSGPETAASAPAAAADPASGPAAPEPTPGPGAYAERPLVQAWAQSTAARLNLRAEDLLSSLAQAVYQPAVVRAVMPAPVGATRRKNWAAYRGRFLDPVRVRAGVAFMGQHDATLRRAEERWGVPVEILVGILGVETIYGRHTGGYRVLDALATLAFDFPTERKDRSAFFRDELGELMRLARQQGRSPESYLGSYAGAMGWPQFMPGSWNRYGVDFDGDGRADLIGSPVDAIGSVANFLAAHQWVRGLPTHHRIEAPADAQALGQLLEPDILPTFTAQRMHELGARLPGGLPADTGPLALVLLENGEAPPTYVAGTANFYALTRYNWSSYYAMAVIELGHIVVAVARSQLAT